MGPVALTRMRRRGEGEGEGEGEEYDKFNNILWDITSDYGDYLRNDMLL